MIAMRVDHDHIPSNPGILYVTPMNNAFMQELVMQGLE